MAVPRRTLHRRRTVGRALLLIAIAVAIVALPAQLCLVFALLLLIPTYRR